MKELRIENIDEKVKETIISQLNNENLLAV